MSFLCLISHLLALIKTVSLCIPGGPNFLWVPSASLLPLRSQWGKPGILNTVYLAHSEKTTPGFLLEHSQCILQRSPPPRAARDVCWGFVCFLKLSLRTQLVPPFPLSRVVFIFEPGVCVLCLESAAPSLAAVRCWCLGSGMPCLAEEQRWVHQALWPFLCRLWFLQSQIWMFNGIGKCFCRGKGGLENGSLCKRQVSCKGAAKDKNFKDYRFCCKPRVLSSGILWSSTHFINFLQMTEALREVRHLSVYRGVQQEMQTWIFNPCISRSPLLGGDAGQIHESLLLQFIQGCPVPPPWLCPADACKP